jgi:hypothetical protein
MVTCSKTSWLTEMERLSNFPYINEDDFKDLLCEDFLHDLRVFQYLYLIHYKEIPNTYFLQYDDGYNNLYYHDFRFNREHILMMYDFALKHGVQIKTMENFEVNLALELRRMKIEKIRKRIKL